MMEAVRQYQKYLIEVKVRQGCHLGAILNFYHGKQNAPSTITFDPKEFQQLEAASVVKMVNSFGVGIKIAGIFERTKFSFALSKVKAGRNYIATIKQDTVSSVKNILPIMDRDLWTFFQRFQVINIDSAQEKLFHAFSAACGWRIESIIVVEGKLLNKSSDGLIVGNVSFDIHTLNGTRHITMTVETNTLKTRKTQSETAAITVTYNKRKESVVMAMIEVLQIRGLFKINVHDDPQFLHPEALKIREDVKSQYLFCKMNAKGQLFPDQSIGLTIVNRYMQSLAKSLNLPTTQISHRVYRKGAAFKGALKTMVENGALVTLREISGVLNTLGLWHAESSMRYLQTRDGVLENTLQKYRDMVEVDPTIKPEDVHQFTTDKSLDEYYIEVDHEIVDCIFNAYNLIWGSSLSAFRRARKVDVACAINNFLSDNAPQSLQHRSINDLNPKEKCWISKQHLDFTMIQTILLLISVAPHVLLKNVIMRMQRVILFDILKLNMAI